MIDDAHLDSLTAETTELLSALIQNQCVNDGTAASGQEIRNAELLIGELDGTGAEIERFETSPGRTSIVARRRGTNPEAPSLMLMGHTDVVPVSADSWLADPFGGERIGDEIWGRGAVDMLNVTASMAVVFRDLARRDVPHDGDIVFFAVADEEAGGKLGAEALVESDWDALECDYVLTEYGGTPIDRGDDTTVLLTTAEKGLGSRRLRIKGEPGHGSMPWGTDNAISKASEIVRRIDAYDPGAKIDDLFKQRVKAFGLPVELEAKLVDPGRINEALDEIQPHSPALARNLHSCCHTSFSPTIIGGGTKNNVIPDEVTLEVDIRILPGESQADVEAHLLAAIGPELMQAVDTEVIYDGYSTESTTDSPLWSALVDSIHMTYPGAHVIPSMVTGGTDARFFRRKGIPAYGAGLLSKNIDPGEFMNRFHGHNERIDIESLRLTTKLWSDVIDRLWV